MSIVILFLKRSNQKFLQLQIQESKATALADERQQVILSKTAEIDSLEEEKSQLISFLCTFSDTAFINNRDFSNPF